MSNAESHYDNKEDDGQEVAIGDVSNVMGSNEINQQIATAKRYPRSVAAFRREALELVTQDVEIASQCTYVLPRKREDNTYINGPSARFAEIILSCWRNTRSAGRVVDIGDEYITAEAIFYDVQNNTAIRYENMRRITTRDGNRYSADMIGVTGNAAVSIALRNAILKGIPKAFWNDIWERSRVTAAGNEDTFNKRRTAVLKAFEELKVTALQLYSFLEIKGIQDITTDHMMSLAGILTAIKDGDTSVAEVFGGATAGGAAGKQQVGTMAPTNKPQNEFVRPNGGAKQGKTIIDQPADPKPKEAKQETGEQTGNAAAVKAAGDAQEAARKQQVAQGRAQPLAENNPGQQGTEANRWREPGEDNEEVVDNSAPTDMAAEIAAYYKDRVADIANCKNAREVGDLKDEVVPNLDDENAHKFQMLCLARTREILANKGNGNGNGKKK